MVESIDIEVQDIQPQSKTKIQEEILELLDVDGNPLKLSESLKYKIISEAGNVLKEGTLTEENTISLEGIKTRSFALELESFDVINTECFDCINQVEKEPED